MAMPQVIAPGAIDMINFGPISTLPQKFRGRNYLPHNDLVTLVRTTPEENRQIGQTIGERLGDPAAPTTVLVPKRGVSALDQEGGPFFDPHCIRAFVEGLKMSINSKVQVAEVDRHINDPEFAEALVSASLEGRRFLTRNS